MEREANQNLQLEEIEALQSIFGDEWECVDETDRVFNIVINDEQTITLQIVFTDCYPLDGPPIYRLNAPWLKREAKQRLANELEKLYTENIGQQLVFIWVERVKEFLFTKEYSNDTPSSNVAVDHTCEANESESSYELNEEEYEKSLKENTLFENTHHQDIETDSNEETPVIIHGEPICDRKSTFQAHLAVVKNRAQVKLFQDKLLENRKISNATHNIMAYRINQINSSNATPTVISNCDDDGETGASSRMLFLMKTLEVENVIVVVSRWYGGIHLGPDRFKHINNCCREILETNGYLKKTKLKQQKRKS